MLPPGWQRDISLLAALCIAGGVLGNAVGNAGLGLAAAVLVFLVVSLRRARRLQRWLVEGVLRSDPPVHGGMLGDLADRFRHQQGRLQRDLDRLGSEITQLREAYSALRDGIVILGPDNVIDWFNSSAGELLGLRQPADIGRQIVHLLRSPDFSAFLGRGEYSGDFEFAPSASRDTVLQIQAAGFGAASKVLFVRDVTTLRRLETMRRDFVANISHELRTPLTVIAGYLDAFEGFLPPDRPAALRALEQMREQARRMESLLEDLLLLSRFEGGAEARPEPIPVAALLGATRDSALAACSGDRHIEIDCDPGLVVVADRAQVESIVSNLVFNAVNYTPSGGRILVSFRREGGGLVLEVGDNGIGIDPVHIPRLTERFYRVDKSRSLAGGGTGLGLAIVKHALNRLGGRLEIQSRPGAGSTFRCILPARLLAGA